MRELARGRQRAVRGPAIHREQQRLHGPAVVERVVPLLSDGLRRRKRRRAMLAGGEQIDPDVVHHRRVARSVHRRVDERGGAAPVFVFRIRVEDLRQQVGRSRVREKAVGDTRLGVALRDIGERKDVRGIEEIQVRVAVPGGLCETVIEAAPARSGNLSDDAIEHLAVAFVPVETVVEVSSEKSAALRNAERQRAVDRPGRNRPRAGRRVLQHGDHVANRRWPQSHERRVLRGVDHLVNLAGLELRRHIHACRIRHCAGAVSARESPLASRHDAARPFHGVAHGHHVLRRFRVDDRIGGVIAIGQRMIRFLFGDDEVAADKTSNRSPILGCRRRIDAHQSRALRCVELPADPQQGEALSHQESVAQLGVRARIDASSRVVEEAEHPLPAAIGHLVEHGAIASSDVLRLDQEKIG